MKKFSKGFTLIELIIVVAIVGILFAVLKGAIWDDNETAFTSQPSSNSFQSQGESTYTCVDGFVVQRSSNAESEVNGPDGKRLTCNTNT